MKAKSFWVIVMLLTASLAVYSQLDYSDYLVKARKRIAEGNCDAAQRNYNVYKELTGNRDLNLEDAVRNCNKGVGEKTNVPQGYVDLGLPSGTLWKYQNEPGSYTFDEAVSKFGNKLPTREQCEELKNSCQWTWQGHGYKVVGPSGEFIFLDASGGGSCACDGCEPMGYDFGVGGYYWSSTPIGSDTAWILYFNSGKVGMYKFYRCNDISVRLVK